MALDFEMISEVTPTGRRDFLVGTAGITSPHAANPLVLGEFLELNSSYQAIRGAGTPAAVPSFAVFGEQGRTDIQTLGKAPLLYLHWYEAQTKVMDATGITLGEALEVSDVTYGALTRRGLVQFTAGYVIGYATRLPADNNGYLRFIRMG